MTILVTGAAGFIGYHVAEALLARGEHVVGLDNLNAYYDVRLKRARLAGLEGRAGFSVHRVDLADRAAQDYRTLSGGERQRARIAQVLLQDADILLLDEPLQHLDLRHQAQAMRTFSRCASGGKTVLAALHEPGHAARYCGFAVLLYDAGRASPGRSSEMLTQANLEALYQCPLEAAGTRSFLPS